MAPRPGSSLGKRAGLPLLLAALLALRGEAASGRANVPSGTEAAPPDDPAPYEESIDVSLLSLTVRVVDTWGRPIHGLGPHDFRVEVDGVEATVVALDWYGSGALTTPDPRSIAAGEAAVDDAASSVVAPDGPRLIVVFVQTDLEKTRISGQMRLRPYTRELLAALAPDDRVAVVSFDSHLKLWQDFATDREATHAAIDTAMVFNDELPLPPQPADEPSLRAALDPEAALDAASPERALELIGRALEPLPGEKAIVYLGFGFGRQDTLGIHLGPGYAPAVRALRAARAAVFSLDVTSADEHTLSVGMEELAGATGGMYLSTFRLPQLATAAVAETLGGHYVLTVDPSALAGLRGPLDVHLRGHRGTVLTRPRVLR